MLKAIRSILRYFDLRPQNSLSSLSKRSAAIFDVFTKTQKDCTILNEKIDGVIAAKELEIKILQSDVSGLGAIKSKNTNLSIKISSFINS